MRKAITKKVARIKMKEKKPSPDSFRRVERDVIRVFIRNIASGLFPLRLWLIWFVPAPQTLIQHKRPWFRQYEDRVGETERG
jgi:hypothetical protein